jgi:hypothetical protein
MSHINGAKYLETWSLLTIPDDFLHFNLKNSTFCTEHLQIEIANAIFQTKKIFNLTLTI